MSNIPHHAALVTLLSDEDPRVFAAVRERITSLDEDLARDLLRQCCHSDDSVCRSHAREIMRFFDQTASHQAFRGYCEKYRNGSFDLKMAAFLLARTEYPDILISRYDAKLACLANDIRDRFSQDKNPDIKKISNFFFKELGFLGNMEDYDNPDNSYLNKIIDCKTGSLFGLSLLFKLVMDLCGYSIDIVGYDGYCLCISRMDGRVRLIDAFNRGELVNPWHFRHHLRKTEKGQSGNHFEPMRSQAVIAHMCNDLACAYRKKKMLLLAKVFDEYTLLLGGCFKKPNTKRQKFRF